MGRSQRTPSALANHDAGQCPDDSGDLSHEDSLVFQSVGLVADYQSVPNGPTYMARAVLTYPEKNVELTVDNSDYVQGRP